MNSEEKEVDQDGDLRGTVKGRQRGEELHQRGMGRLKRQSRVCVNEMIINIMLQTKKLTKKFAPW